MLRQAYVQSAVALVFMAVPAIFLGGSFWLIEGRPAWLMFAAGAVAGLSLRFLPQYLEWSRNRF